MKRKFPKGTMPPATNEPPIEPVPYSKEQVRELLAPKGRPCVKIELEIRQLDQYAHVLSRRVNTELEETTLLELHPDNVSELAASLANQLFPTLNAAVAELVTEDRERQAGASAAAQSEASTIIKLADQQED